MIQEFNAPLTSKRELTHDVWHFGFTLEGQTLEFTPGQYMLLQIEDNYRQYSIASANMKHDGFDLIVEILPQGLASNYLKNLPIGEKVTFKGPAGVFTLKDTEKNKIFLATGTGIAPITSMIESYFAKEQAKASLTLFFGVHNRGEVYLFDEFKNISAQHPNFNFRICLSREENVDGLDGACFSSGRVNNSLDEFIKGKNPNDFEYYICGSKQAVDSLKEYVAGLGVAVENIYFERFTL